MNRKEKALEILHNGTVIPAIPLVLDENRNFDEKKQKRLTRYYLEAGVGGIAVAVHTTQFEIRQPKYNLFEKVISVVSAEIDKYEKETGKTIVKVAGICGETEQAVREAKTISEYGFDAGLLSPGGLGYLSEDEMVERTAATAKIIPIIGFYLQVAAGGRHFSYNYWQRICAIDNVVAIKSAPFNRYATIDVARAAALSPRADKIALYTGNDDNIVVDLMTESKCEEHGKVYTKKFVGGLLGHWSVYTHAAVNMFNKIKSGSLSLNEILTLAEQVTDMNSAVFDVANNFKGCIPGVHEVLRRQGLMDGTWCLNEKEILSEGQAEEIERISSAYPYLTDDEFVKEFLKNYKD